MLVYGKNVAKEILKNGKKVNKIYMADSFDDKEINSILENKKITIETLDKRGISRFAKYSHQGIILDIEDFIYKDITEIMQKEDAIIVILDHLEDPHNLGAIIRTCEAAGIDGIVIPKDRSVEVNSTVMKTSAGALENMAICRVTNIVETMKELKKNNFWIVGTDMENSQDYRTIDYSGRIALVIGSEGFGISKLVAKECDFIASIPMHGKINSLNASVAAAIMVYEIIRNRK